MAPAAEISKLLASRWLLAAVDIAARINQRCAVLGDPDVYDNAAFPWANQLSTRWQVIRAELDHVLERRAEISPVQEIIAGAGSITDDAGWKIYCAGGTRCAVATQHRLVSRDVAAGPPDPQTAQRHVFDL